MFGTMPQPTHMCIVKRNTFGMWYPDCSCGWKGQAYKYNSEASEAREGHLRGAMQADPMAKWSAWMVKDELPKEP